jgi:hypothetical protein
MHVPAVRRRSNTRFGLLSMIANMTQIADLRGMRVTREMLRGEKFCCRTKGCS